MKPNIILMNFTHVYEQERFINDIHFQWIDCTDLNGTNCYCDAEAAKVIRQRMTPYLPEGIHFIDSGNYHYISKFWTDKIKTPFSLVVFDHHPDMQPSLFDNLMSCGCWVKKVLDTNPYLQKVCIVGAAEKLIKALHPNYGEKLKFYSETELSHEEGWNRFSHEHLNEPVYISVDKDVLDIKSAVTNWDQGSLSLTELEKLLSIILKKEEIIGVDICGECSSSLDVFQKNRELSINSKANKELLNLFLSNQNEIHPL